MKNHVGIACTLLLVVCFGLGTSFAQQKASPSLNGDEVALVKESLKGLPENRYRIKLIEPDGKGGSIEKTYGKMDWTTIEAGKASSGLLAFPYVRLNKIRFQRLQIIGPGCFDIIWYKNFKEAFERNQALDRIFAQHL